MRVVESETTDIRDVYTIFYIKISDTPFFIKMTFRFDFKLGRKKVKYYKRNILVHGKGPRSSTSSTDNVESVKQSPQTWSH